MSYFAWISTPIHHFARAPTSTSDFRLSFELMHFTSLWLFLKVSILSMNENMCHVDEKYQKSFLHLNISVSIYFMFFLFKTIVMVLFETLLPERTLIV